MFAPLVDYVTGRTSAWRAKNSAAFVALTNPATGVPYDSTNPLPVDATVVMPTGLATSALQTTGNASLSSIDGKIPAQATPGLVPVDTLGTPGTPRVQATSGTAASIALTTTCRRISMYATQGTWYAITGTATATSHYVASGERIDLDVPASTTVSVLQETTAGSIRITELV